MKKLFGEKSKPRTFLNALVVFVLIFAFFICILLTACDNKIDKDKTNKTPTQNEQTGGNQGGQENQGSQTGGNQGEQTGGNQGGQTGGETGGEETPNPEKTPAEYKAECEQKISDKLEEKIDEWWGEKGAKVSSFKLNTVDGTIYAKAKVAGTTKDSFFTVKSNLSGSDNLSYKQISEKCDNLSLTVQKKDVILSQIVSSDKYNALCNYVLSQCDLQDSEILNVTKFAGTGDGRNGTTLTVLYNNKIATIDARCYSASTDNNESIDYMLSSETNYIRITSYEDYKDFDNIVSAEAGISSYQVKLA